MEVRAKKALGQHWLVDQGVARRIVASLLEGPGRPEEEGETGKKSGAGEDSGAGLENGTEQKTGVLEIGPGMGVLTQYLLQRPDIDLRMVEVDDESVRYLLTHYNGLQGRLYEADFLKLDLHRVFPGSYCVIGNFPYNISSQIFFRILDERERVPEVVCMIQKEVAERIACGPGSKVYGILSVLLQAWYGIEYLFTVEPGAFAPPPKVRSAVIRLRRNSRTELSDGETGAKVDDDFFRKVVKTAFGQRRKTLRNTLRPLLPEGFDLADPILGKRAEQLSVEDFIALAASMMGSPAQ